jgi:ferredoxin
MGASSPWKAQHIAGAPNDTAPARTDAADATVLDVEGLVTLLEVLARRGYRVLGPRVRDGAIVHGELSSVADLPRGWHDAQSPGSYRIEHTDDEAFFAWAVGPSSPKREVFPARSVAWRARVSEGEVAFEDGDAASELRPTALVGARPCEAAALGVLDRVLGDRGAGDPQFLKRREGAFLVVVECATPSGTCFCDSMGTGPAAGNGFDLALTELAGDGGGHRFLARAGSEIGAEVLSCLPGRPADEADRAARAALLERARTSMGRVLDTAGLPALLARNVEHPRFDEVAERCLACGNCTLVCPTCFCSTVEDASDVAGVLERRRSWSSCFDLAHSYLHGGPVRASTMSRYRQWMTHKLSTWWDQFETSGCVGCGRCITWCPVGIDITEEAAAIRRSDGARRGRRGGR